MKFVFMYESVHEHIVAKEKYAGIVIELKCECHPFSVDFKDNNLQTLPDANGTNYENSIKIKL